MLSDSENLQHLELHEPPKAGRWKRSAVNHENTDAETVVEAVVAVDEDTDINISTEKL
jgi:hypothetical protein